jgi:GH15 family glucan-1,4-alpha-glucosidase
MSIWEVRNNKQNFTYSKIMLWVAFDRGIRLAEKRNLPCPNRETWLRTRDSLYEEIMEKGRVTISSPSSLLLKATQAAHANGTSLELTASCLVCSKGTTRR